MRRPVVPELHDQLGQVRLVRRDACRGQRVVQADLVGRQRLDLYHLGGAGLLHEPVTIAFASVASLAQCTTPPRAWTAASSCSR